MRDLIEIGYPLAHKTKTVTIASVPWVVARNKVFTVIVLYQLCSSSVC